jgi:hypothetical protein
MDTPVRSPLIAKEETGPLAAPRLTEQGIPRSRSLAARAVDDRCSTT